LFTGANSRFLAKGIIAMQSQCFSFLFGISQRAEVFSAKPKYALGISFWSVAPSGRTIMAKPKYEKNERNAKSF
jgi:hypothetical protein